jgi:hypothetical protein
VWISAGSRGRTGKDRRVSGDDNNNNNNNNSIDSLQNTAILGTSHIIRKVLQCEARRLRGGDHRWFKGKDREGKACDRRR